MRISNMFTWELENEVDDTIRAMDIYTTRYHVNKRKYELEHQDYVTYILLPHEFWGEDSQYAVIFTENRKTGELEEPPTTYRNSANLTAAIRRKRKNGFL